MARYKRKVFKLFGLHAVRARKITYINNIGLEQLIDCCKGVLFIP